MLNVLLLFLSGLMACKRSLFGHFSVLPSISIRPELSSSIFCNSRQQMYRSILGIYAVIFPKSTAVLISALLLLLTAAFIMAR